MILFICTLNKKILLKSEINKKIQVLVTINNQYFWGFFSALNWIPSPICESKKNDFKKV